LGILTINLTKGDENVWILTLYSADSIKMFEYENKDEACEKYDKVDGCKILSEIIYYTDIEKNEPSSEL
jgi:hypothetical protein